LIGTHIHEDHTEGMTGIINDFPIKKIFILYNEKDDFEFYNKVKKVINSKGLLIESLKETGRFSLGENIEFKILYVDNTELSKANNTSIVAELTYANQRYLFMGDTQREVENKLISKGMLNDVDVLRVGHHGSDTSTTENFINKILP
jgi:competence protein ComEC